LGGKKGALRLGLDAFGDQVQPETSSKRDHRCNNGHVVLVERDVLDE
jgi:hypothetical protein